MSLDVEGSSSVIDSSRSFLSVAAVFVGTVLIGAGGAACQPGDLGSGDG